MSHDLTVAPHDPVVTSMMIRQHHVIQMVTHISLKFPPSLANWKIQWLHSTITIIWLTVLLIVLIGCMCVLWISWYPLSSQDPTVPRLTCILHSNLQCLSQAVHSCMCLPTLWTEMELIVLNSKYTLLDVLSYSNCMFVPWKRKSC